MKVTKAVRLARSGAVRFTLEIDSVVGKVLAEMLLDIRYANHTEDDIRGLGISYDGSFIETLAQRQLEALMKAALEEYSYSRMYASIAGTTRLTPTGKAIGFVEAIEEASECPFEADLTELVSEVVELSQTDPRFAAQLIGELAQRLAGEELEEVMRYAMDCCKRGGVTFGS